MCNLDERLFVQEKYDESENIREGTILMGRDR